jgi:2'-hydroxyisoflavone reductase
VLLEAIEAKIGHYTFISSVSAYADLGLSGVTENSPVAAPLDPNEERVTGETYGPLKGACEKAAQDSGIRSVLVVRPGIIVGPGDPTGRFAYWVARVARGGEVLAPGDPQAKIQLIDVRDLADWLVTMAEQQTSGIFNTVGSPSLTWGEMLATCARELGSQTTFTWVGDAFLTGHAINDWSNLPLHISEANRAFAGMFQIDGGAASRRGLGLRPFGETVADTSRWLSAGGAGTRAPLGLIPERERELLLAWRAGRT